MPKLSLYGLPHRLQVLPLAVMMRHFSLMTTDFARMTMHFAPVTRLSALRILTPLQGLNKEPFAPHPSARLNNSHRVSTLPLIARHRLTKHPLSLACSLHPSLATQQTSRLDRQRSSFSKDSKPPLASPLQSTEGQNLSLP